MPTNIYGGYTTNASATTSASTSTILSVDATVFANAFVQLKPPKIEYPPPKFAVGAEVRWLTSCDGYRPTENKGYKSIIGRVLSDDWMRKHPRMNTVDEKGEYIVFPESRPYRYTIYIFDSKNRITKEWNVSEDCIAPMVYEDGVDNWE